MNTKKADSIQLGVRIPREWAEQLNALAQRDVRTVSSIIKHAIKEYLDSRLGEHPKTVAK